MVMVVFDLNVFALFGPVFATNIERSCLHENALTPEMLSTSIATIITEVHDSGS
jgi:hypothetical protein